jgi:hypothetical protein
MNIIPRASRNTDASWLLRLSTLWIRFIAFSPLGWLSIGLWSVVKQPCYIHCNVSTEKFIRLYYGWISLNVSLISLESQLSRSTSLYDHLKLFCGLFWASTTYIVFDAHFASFKFSKPLLNSLFCWCGVCIMFIKPSFNRIFFLPKSNPSLTHELLFYPSFHNKKKLLDSKCYISRTNYLTAVKFIHVSFESWY